MAVPCLLHCHGGPLLRQLTGLLDSLPLSLADWGLDQLMQSPCTETPEQSPRTLSCDQQRRQEQGYNFLELCAVGVTEISAGTLTAQAATEPIRAGPLGHSGITTEHQESCKLYCSEPAWMVHEAQALPACRSAGFRLVHQFTPAQTAIRPVS